MIIGFLADCHVGNHLRFGGEYVSGLNARCRLTLDTLKRAVGQANKKGATVLIICGDLFDSEDPLPQMIAAVQRVLAAFNGRIYVLKGNHEFASSDAGDHALGPLGPVAVVIERPTVLPVSDEQEVLFVPYQPGPAEEWFVPTVEALLTLGVTPDVSRLLVTHLGIRDKDTPHYLLNANDCVGVETMMQVLETIDAQAAFVGNWHHKEVWEEGEHHPRFVVQVGTTCPTGFNNPGLEHFGWMAYWDTDLRQPSLQRVPGPRFLKLDPERNVDKQIPKPVQDKKKRNVVFVEATADRQRRQQIRKALTGFKSMGWIENYEVKPDRKEAKIAAAHAAEAATSAKSFDEALATYVFELPLEELVGEDVKPPEHSTVYERIKQFLGGAT